MIQGSESPSWEHKRKKRPTHPTHDRTDGPIFKSAPVSLRSSLFLRVNYAGSGEARQLAARLNGSFGTEQSVIAAYVSVKPGREGQRGDGRENKVPGEGRIGRVPQKRQEKQLEGGY
ncbi:hypothetical protein SKAU_G00359730 [Synaphobranchus kaupii]|uniref:Uncharacterized protein n=1 Tax=Synaphobranchus kaupii TaxID=118154 RepID=A0A9Q1EI48_SYNKA|nr:hypothetical protein SKAU_G00359730 [Synaphobranchus kaupii]